MNISLTCLCTFNICVFTLDPFECPYKFAQIFSELRLTFDHIHANRCVENDRNKGEDKVIDEYQPE